MNPIIDKIVVMLVRGLKPSDIESLHAKLGVDLPELKSLIIDAQKQITLAADYNRIDEVGRAYLRINDIYQLAHKSSDAKTALAAQKELNRLLRLYEAAQTPQADQQGSEAQRELAAVAEHLLPLNLAKADYPLSGHARIAADLLRQHGLPNVDAT